MKQFIEKTDKVYAFFHDQIFAHYKQIGELTGKEWSFTFSNDIWETVNLSRRIDNGYEMFSCGNNQVLVIKNKQLKIVPKVDFNSHYEEINETKFIPKEIFTEKPPICPQIEDSKFIQASILGMQSRFDVADVIQALINGERFPDCGDSVIENLKQIKFNRPAIAQRLINDIIADFTAADTIQYSTIRLEESKAIFIGHA